MKIGKYTIDRGNIQLLLIVLLLGVVTYMIIFSRNDSDKRRDIEKEKKELEQKIKVLEKEEVEHMSKIEEYQLRDTEWIKKDSIYNIKLKEAEDRTNELRKRQIDAEKDRKESVDRLEKFKDNPPIISDPIDLILDTKKRII